MLVCAQTVKYLGYQNCEMLRGQNLVSWNTGVAGGGEEVRPHLVAQFKVRQMGGKFTALQETFGFQRVTN